MNVGLSCGSSFQHSFIKSIINWGPKSSGKGILFFFLKLSITSWFENAIQGTSPLENNSNKTTPNENTSHLEDIFSLNINSGALHYFLNFNKI